MIALTQIADVTAQLSSNPAAALPLLERLAGAAGADEQVGLVRAFLVAGAARVLASLWPVDDAVTARFMAHFYGALQQGLSPAQALGDALGDQQGRVGRRGQSARAAHGDIGGGGRHDLICQQVKFRPIEIVQFAFGKAGLEPPGQRGDKLDRRIEITGPTDRKMVINALNSGAKVFMTDFEDSNSPTLDNLVRGQINLRDRWSGAMDYRDPESGTRMLLDELLRRDGVDPGHACGRGLAQVRPEVVHQVADRNRFVRDKNEGDHLKATRIEETERCSLTNALHGPVDFLFCRRLPGKYT